MTSINWAIVAGIYTLGFLGGGLMGRWMYEDADTQAERRSGARMILASPIWPVAGAALLIWWLARSIRDLFADAFRKLPEEGE